MSRVNSFSRYVILIIFLSTSLCACASKNKPKSQSDLTILADTSASRTTSAFILRQASLEDIEIQPSESLPLQIHVVVKGYLSDGCTKIDRITQERTDNDFSITITTIRPADLNCIQVIVPFEETIPLDVTDLNAGVYTVTVNNMSDTFTLEAENSQK
jgi:inhibitor of cysteine peptidase